jgi:cysteine desulfurase
MATMAGMASRVYADHAATTPMLPIARDAWLAASQQVGNPSSLHASGRHARRLVEEARERIAGALTVRPSAVVFTAGGTESDNLAVKGLYWARHRATGARRILLSAIEHHAVLDPVQWLVEDQGAEQSWLPVDQLGRVDADAVVESLARGDVALCTVMWANNEIGTVQPIVELAEIAHEFGVPIHSDAVQAFGKIPFQDIHQFEADLVSVCAHKFHGPKGAGALFVKSPLQPLPTQVGGGHENERRAGTENLAAIVGLAVAFERCVVTPAFDASALLPLTERLAAAAAAIPGVTLRHAPEGRLANTIAFSVEGTDGIALMATLDLEGICASSGSACSAGSLEPSHVLSAMGVPAAAANALVRFSLGRDSTEAEVDRVAAVLPGLIQRLRNSR